MYRQEVLRGRAMFHFTIALVSSFLLNNILIKEPVVQNPYKLAYKVIRYAIKTSTLNAEVHSHSLKMSFEPILLILILAGVYMEDHSQQSRWKTLQTLARASSILMITKCTILLLLLL